MIDNAFSPSLHDTFTLHAVPSWNVPEGVDFVSCICLRRGFFPGAWPHEQRIKRPWFIS